MRNRENFRVEATDDFSAKVAGTVVSNEGGKVCPVRRTYDQIEDKTTCVYECAMPTGPLTRPGNVECPQLFEPE